MQDKPYTVASLAAHWQCSDTFVYDRLNSGELAGFKLGGKLWRIRAEAVEAYEQRSVFRVSDETVSDESAGSEVAPVNDRTRMRLLRGQ